MWATYLVPDLDRLRVVFQIEVPAGKHHATLIKLCDDVRRIVEIRLRAKAKQRRIGFGISGIPDAGNRTMEIGHDLNELTSCWTWLQSCPIEAARLGGRWHFSVSDRCRRTSNRRLSARPACARSLAWLLLRVRFGGGRSRSTTEACRRSPRNISSGGTGLSAIQRLHAYW